MTRGPDSGPLEEAIGITDEEEGRDILFQKLAPVLEAIQLIDELLR